MQVTAFVLLALLVASAPALAEFRKTLVIGGNGGVENTAMCETGSAVVELVAVQSKDLNSVAGVCQSLANGHPTGDRAGLPTFGDPNIDDRAAHTTSTRCPDDMVVQAVVVGVSNADLVHTLTAVCRNLTTGAQITPDGLSNRYGGEAFAERTADCGPTGYAVGVVASHGAMVDAVGLLCEVVVPQKPIKTSKGTAATPQKPIKTNRGTPLPINNGGTDDGGGTGNGGGQQAVSPGGTTVYKQDNGDESDDNVAGFVDPGGTVTVTTCQGNGFCKISAPVAGFVWHEDIGR